ncbi:Hypp5953 [Branchiostoma lanceolatum]|uniref:Hypp5953 protein n=1 Tax=Branchiostoma lanceolatum TaxID=7740 RepID=A0A8J9VH46_BRALA|nr:Hypp5953 [Branchiostoma lanceolatum]
MGRKGIFVVALLSLACFSTLVAGQNLSASFYETLGYYTQLALSKSIDWNTTMDLRDSGQVQQPCYDQSVQLHTDMQAGKSYAIQMLDSSGKFNPTGLFEGQWDAIGSFKGCRDRVKNAPDIPSDLKPMYCAVVWGGIPPEMVETTGTKVFTQGLCVPNTCGDSEVGLLAGTGLLGIKPMPSWTPGAVLCQREEDVASFDTKAIVAISTIAVILLILVISTLYEFIINVSFSKERMKSITSSKTGRFLLSFSVYSNTKKVFDTYQPPGQIPALHGIRVISTLWIIYGHTDTFASVSITRNQREKREFYSEWWAFINRNMDKSVDTFLLLRLTPVYAFLIMNLCLLDELHGDGTRAGKVTCFGWAWYLGVDMQLYIVAPGLLLLLYNVGGQDYFTVVYKVTFTRQGPYMVGLLLGYILFKTGRKVPTTRRTKVLMTLGWLFASFIGLLFGLVYDRSPAFVTFDRTMFSCAVAWVVFACSVGYGGIITEFLSWSGWVPLSRLTYTAYLVHPIIMYVYTMSLKPLLFYSVATWWFYFIAYSFMAFLCGFVASIMVEFPFFGLEKLIFPQRRGRDSSKASKNVTNEAHDNQLQTLELAHPTTWTLCEWSGTRHLNRDFHQEVFLGEEKDDIEQIPHHVIDDKAEGHLKRFS